MAKIAIISLVLLAAGAARAGERRLDPALQGGDITVCRGLLTSSGTCIGSESSVTPDSYSGTTIYRERRDQDDDRRHRDRDQDD